MPWIKAVTPDQCAEPLVPPNETPEINLNLNWTLQNTMNRDIDYMFVFSAVTALASITEMSCSISEHIKGKTVKYKL